MKTAQTALFLALGALLFASPAHAGDTVRRLALVVGNNTGFTDDAPLRFAEKDAHSIAAVLRELGGFDHIELVTGQNAGRVKGALETVTARIARYKRNNESVFFLFYYSGHGDTNGLRTSNTRLDSEELLASIKGSGADLRIAIIDACQSGSMTRNKGLVAASKPKVELVDRLDVTGQAVLASTSVGESAQESESLGGSFFTSYLVSALRGAADKNGDAAVSLLEAYGYAFDRTLVSTVVSAAGTQHPTYDFDLSGSRDVVLTWPERGASTLRISARTPGKFLVTSADQVVVAELVVDAQGVRDIGLPEGIYRVEKRAETGLLRAQLALHSGSAASIDEAGMMLVPYTALAEKGPQVDRSVQLDDSTGGLGPWTWTSLGATIVLGGVATGLTISAASLRDEARAALVASKEDPSIPASKAHGLEADRSVRSGLATGFWAGCGAAAAATVITALVETRRAGAGEPPPPKSVVSVLPQNAGAVLVIDF